jgi:hypothetical protein
MTKVLTFLLCIDINYPCYLDDGSEQIQVTTQKLFDEDELIRIAASAGGLVWINYFKDLPNDPSITPGEGQARQYKGQWKSSDMKIWEGFGIIKFGDGSVYQG